MTGPVVGSGASCRFPADQLWPGGSVPFPVLDGELLCLDLSTRLIERSGVEDDSMGLCPARTFIPFIMSFNPPLPS